MQITKPKPPRVYVSATDAITRKSDYITLYETTPAEVIDQLRKLAKDAGKPSRSTRSKRS